MTSNFEIYRNKAGEVFYVSDWCCLICLAKVRRLYDIANILTSINFLEKCVSYEDATKKAAYKWIGLDLKMLHTGEGISSISYKHE